MSMQDSREKADLPRQQWGVLAAGMMEAIQNALIVKRTQEIMKAQIWD